MTGMSNDALIVQLVEWIGQEPRSYAETIDAWRTSCPRLTVWEDALSAGLIERVPAAGLKEAQVRVTPAGQACLSTRERTHARA